MSPGRVRRIARMTAEAAELGMTLEQWRQMRAESARIRERRFLDRLIAGESMRDREFRLAHPQAMYPDGLLGDLQYRVDALMQQHCDDFNRQMLYGDGR